MPNTQNYSFNFESPGSLPGTTLTGGPEGGNAILARQVDTALAAVETKVDANTANVTANADDLNTFEARFQSGTELFTFSGQTIDTIVVPFPTTYTSAPVVMTNISSGAGETGRWGSRAINISTSQFTLFVFATDDNGTETQNWTDIPVDWLSFGA